MKSKISKYIRIGFLFAVIILFCLSACTCKQTERNLQSMKVEKKWAIGCSKDSKIHILPYNAQFLNGERVLSIKQTYIKMTKECMNDIEALITKYLEERDHAHYCDKKNNTLDFYFRQYLCYKENTQLFVFVNLYAYRITRYEINTNNVFANNPNIHVINPLNGNNKDYKILIVNLSEKSICSFNKK